MQDNYNDSVHSLPVTCLALPSPDNGGVEYNLPQLDIVGRLDYDEGAIATFSCDNGYHLNGDTERVCTSVGVIVGMWSGASPVCQGIYSLMLIN